MHHGFIKYHISWHIATERGYILCILHQCRKTIQSIISHNTLTTTAVIKKNRELLLHCTCVKNKISLSFHYWDFVFKGFSHFDFNWPKEGKLVRQPPPYYLINSLRIDLPELTDIPDRCDQFTNSLSSKSVVAILSHFRHMAQWIHYLTVSVENVWLQHKKN